MGTRFWVRDSGEQVMAQGPKGGMGKGVGGPEGDCCLVVVCQRASGAQSDRSELCKQMDRRSVRGTDHGV